MTGRDPIRTNRRTVLAGLGAATGLVGGGAGLGVASDTARASAARYERDVHRAMTRIGCAQKNVDFGPLTVAVDAVTAPDDWDCDCDPDAIAEEVVPDWMPEERERYVAHVVERMPLSYNHYYNPRLEITLWGYTVDLGEFGDAPDNVDRYARRAAGTRDDERFRNLGYALHFLQDVGQPLHTGEEIDQARNEWVHYSYEDGVAAHWGDLVDAFRGDGDARTVENPKDATRALARLSHERSERIYELVEANRNWADDPGVRPELLSITRDCLSATGRYVRGLIEWVDENGEGEVVDDPTWWPWG